jgi:hypothetical protein
LQQISVISKSSSTTEAVRVRKREKLAVRSRAPGNAGSPVFREFRPTDEPVEISFATFRDPSARPPAGLRPLRSAGDRHLTHIIPSLTVPTIHSL